MDPILAAQEAVGVLPLNGDGGGLDARLVVILVVEGFDGEVVALRPAGVHPVEHLAPVLGLGAAGAGVEAEDGVAVVVLAGEQGGQIGLLQGPLQAAEALAHLRQEALVVLLHGHLHQGGQILPLAHQPLVVLQLVLELLGALEHLLGPGHIVPEIGVVGLLLQLLHLPAGPLQIQGRSQTVQAGAQGGELLLVDVVFNNGHGESSKLSLWFYQLASLSSHSGILHSFSKSFSGPAPDPWGYYAINRRGL